MNKKFILGIFVLGILMTSAFVSAGLFSAKITGNAVASGWTNWYDRDNAGGSGDYETINALKGDGKAICGEMEISDIECQTTNGVDYSETGQVVTCDVNMGFVCRNADNEKTSWFSSPCDDYQVRFYCGGSSEGSASCYENYCTFENPSSITYMGAEIKLISATDSSAIISVDGESKELKELVTSEIGGLKIGLVNSDENTALNTLSVKIRVDNSDEIVGGANKVNLGELSVVTLNYLDKKYVVKRITGCDFSVTYDGNTEEFALQSLSVKTLSNGVKVKMDNYQCSDSRIVLEFEGSPTSSTTTSTEVTYQGVLDMLNSCKILIPDEESCTQRCAQVGRTCVTASAHFVDISGGYISSPPKAYSWDIECDKSVLYREIQQESNHSGLPAIMQCLCCSAP